MMLLRVFSWLVISVSFCFCGHTVTFPIADGGDQLSFYRAPFERQIESLPQRNFLINFPEPVQSFNFVPSSDIQFAQSNAQPLVGLPTRYAGGYTQEAGKGHKDHADHYVKSGKTTDEGYESNHHKNEGDHTKSDENHKAGHHEEKGGKKKNNHDEASHYKKHHEEKKAHKSAKFGEKKGHKKGHKTKGYHNKFHKDEYHREHKFYDDFHKSGHHSKHGSFNTKHKKEEGGFKKGDRHKSGHESNKKAKKHHEDKGHIDKEHKESEKSGGREKYHKHHKKEGKKNGHQTGKSYGFSEKQ